MSKYNPNISIASKQIEILPPLSRAEGNDVRRICVTGTDDMLEALAVDKQVFNSPATGKQTAYILILDCDLNNSRNASMTNKDKMAQSQEMYDICEAICEDKGYKIHPSNA